jgi:hypothetical protein
MYAARPLLRLAAEGGGGTLYSREDAEGRPKYWFAGTQIGWDDERDEDVWIDWKTDGTSDLSGALPSWWYRTQPTAMVEDTDFRARLRGLYETAISVERSGLARPWNEWIVSLEVLGDEATSRERKPDYNAAVRAHLSRYKAETLGVAEHGVWSGNGKPYPHILPDSMYGQNILAPIRTDVLAYMKQHGISRHRDFHHLNSSQALCFNLFFPFFMGPHRDPAPLLRALGLPAREVTDASFEHVKDAAEGTNFDFFATFESVGAAASQPRLHIEVKFTERGFGTCADDEAHRAKLRHRYRRTLEGKVDSAALKDEMFFAHYQFWRNVAYADVSQDSTVLFLVPRGNVGLVREWEAISALLTEAVRPAVRHAFLEDVLDDLLSATPQLNLALASYVPQLAAKYGVR